jgi:hypothetical protein
VPFQDGTPVDDDEHVMTGSWAEGERRAAVRGAAAPTKVKERKRAGYTHSCQVNRSRIRLDLSQARSRRGIRGAKPRPDRNVPRPDSIDVRQRSIHATRLSFDLDFRIDFNRGRGPNPD